MKNKSWTKEENLLLQEYFYKLSRSALEEIFNRPHRELRAQVQELEKKNKEFQK